MYIHCYDHCLNLALVDTTKQVQEASEFFVIMQNLYVFLSLAKAHTIFLHKQHEEYPNKSTRQLQCLPDTRWACRYFAVEVVYSTNGAILSTLEAIINGQRQLNQRVFCFTNSILFWRILSCTKSLSHHLQSPQTNLAKHVTLLLETLQLCRTDEEWDNHYKYITESASFLALMWHLVGPAIQGRYQEDCKREYS